MHKAENFLSHGAPQQTSGAGVLQVLASWNLSFWE